MTSSPPSSSDRPAAPTDVSSAFALLDPRVQRWIWQRGWTSLRGIQELATTPILGGKDVVITASTAGGKTEAAFLPICSMLAASPAGGVRALYVGPLKALINDQFGRLEELCEQLDVPVHRWHGDVAASKKQKILKKPDGILLITPESLEAMFVNHGPRVPVVFSGLSYIVIDELHAFLGSERGQQLQSLLHRIERALGRRVPRVGLSATLGDMGVARRYLRIDGADDVVVIQSDEDGPEVKLQVKGFVAGRPPDGTAALVAPTEALDPELTEHEGVEQHLFEVLRGGHHLVFANRRQVVELLADHLRRRCESANLPNEFFPHHGSLSKDLREEVETRLKETERPLTVVCTTTLEMGIDIGPVQSVAQVGPPSSVSSLRQRLGRSGRRGEASILRQYVVEEPITAQSSVEDLLRVGLVQAVAAVNLLLDKWCEPPRAGALHLSTLVQQVLSMIAERGGIRAADAFVALCQTGPFREVTPAMFATFLRGLGAHDLVTQTHDGLLVLGLDGERVVNHFSFYASFATPEEFRIVAGDRLLGTLPVDFPVTPGLFLIFAGRRWEVVTVDVRGKTILVVSAPGGRAPKFGGTGAEVHDRVRHEMLRVYTSTDTPIFLDRGARDLLLEGRREFGRLGLTTSRLLADGTATQVLPWRGDRVLNTLAIALQAVGQQVTRSAVALILERATPETASIALQAALSGPLQDAVGLARSLPTRVVEKFDLFVDDDLLAEDHAGRAFDTDGARACALEILGSP